MRYERLSILNDPNANPAHKPYFAPMSDDVYIFIARNFFQQLNITAITEDNFHHILDALCAYRTIYFHLGVYELVDSVNFILDELCEYLPVEPKLRYRHRNSLYRPPYEELYFSQAQKHKFVENVNPDAQEEYNNAIYGRARWCKDEKKKRYFIVPTMWRNEEKAKLSNLNEPKSTIIDEIPNEYPEEQIDKDVYDYLYLDTIRDIEASRRKERKEKYYQDIHEYSERAYKEKASSKQYSSHQDNLNSKQGTNAQTNTLDSEQDIDVQHNTLNIEQEISAQQATDNMSGTPNSKQDTSTNSNRINSEQDTSTHSSNLPNTSTQDEDEEDDASEFLTGPRYVRADVSNLNKDAVDYLFEIGLLVSGDKCEEQETETDIKYTKNTKKYTKNTENNLEHVKSKEILDMVNKIKKKG